VALLIGATLTGTCVSILDLVRERSIYRHERAAGLLPEGYLLGKLLVLCAIASVQATALAVLIRIARPGPTHAVLLGQPELELVVALVGTAVVSCCLGAAISASVATTDQAIGVAAVTMLLQIFLCGGIVSLAGRPFLGTTSLIVPARWAYAAAASTVGLRSADGAAHDGLWTQSSFVWLCYFLVLAVLAAGCVGLTLARLRR
jgi:hypothetical protein